MNERLNLLKRTGKMCICMQRKWILTLVVSIYYPSCMMYMTADLRDVGTKYCAKGNVQCAVKSLFLTGKCWTDSTFQEMFLKWFNLKKKIPPDSSPAAWHLIKFIWRSTKSLISIMTCTVIKNSLLDKAAIRTESLSAASLKHTRTELLQTNNGLDVWDDICCLVACVDCEQLLRSTLCQAGCTLFCKIEKLGIKCSSILKTVPPFSCRRD